MDSIYFKQRWKIIFYTLDPKGPKMSEQELTDYLKIGKTTVNKWKARFQKTGGVDDEPKLGRARATSVSDDMLISKTAAETPPRLVANIAKKLEAKDVVVSPRTIQRRLN